jgi:hypothetical protein
MNRYRTPQPLPIDRNDGALERKRRVRVMTILGIWVALMSCSGAEAMGSPDASASWSPRGVFAFGNLVFDFQKKLEVFGPVTTTLVDCSTNNYFCAYAEYLHIVLPKRCGKFDVGEAWAANGVETKILSTRIEQHNFGVHSYSPSTVLLLGSPKFPGTVYEYEVGSGVRGIYLAKDDEDLVALALKGGISVVSPASRYFQLVTLDPFGACVG